MDLETISVYYTKHTAEVWDLKVVDAHHYRLPQTKDPKVKICNKGYQK